MKCKKFDLIIIDITEAIIAIYCVYSENIMDILIDEEKFYEKT